MLVLPASSCPWCIVILLQNPTLPSLTILVGKTGIYRCVCTKYPWLFPADWDGAPCLLSSFGSSLGPRKWEAWREWAAGHWGLSIFYIYLPGIIVASEGACLRLSQCLDLRNNPSNSVIVFTFYSFKRSNFLIWILHIFHSKINPWRSLHVPTQIIYVRADFPNHQGATLTKSKQEFTPRKA